MTELTTRAFLLSQLRERRMDRERTLNERRRAVGLHAVSLAPPEVVSQGGVPAAPAAEAPAEWAGHANGISPVPGTTPTDLGEDVSEEDLAENEPRIEASPDLRLWRSKLGRAAMEMEEIQRSFQGGGGDQDEMLARLERALASVERVRDDARAATPPRPRPRAPAPRTES